MPLSVVFGAGQRVSASDLNDIVTAINAAQESLWVLTSTSATTAVGTSETVPSGLSAPSSTYLAHTAYEIKFRALYRTTTGTATMTVNMRDTNAAGTQRMSFLLLAATTSNQTINHRHVVANKTGSDITSRVLVVTHTSTSGTNTVQFAGDTNDPWYVECTPLGLDTEYPNAVAL